MIDFDLDTEIKKTREHIKNIDKHFFDDVTVWEAISNLQKPTENGKVNSNKTENNYQKFLGSKLGKTFNHIETKHNSIAIKRMEKIGINENFTVLDEEIKTVHSGSYGN